MSLPTIFTDLSGEWKGTKRLYLAGESGPEKSSGSRLTIAKAARGTFLLLDYTWKFDGDRQEGVLLLGYDAAQNAATAAWGDSWHMSQKIMHCMGTIDGRAFNVRGTAYYHDFGRFVADFENTYPYMRIQNIDLEPAGASASTSTGPAGNAEDGERLAFKMEVITLVNPNSR